MLRISRLQFFLFLLFSSFINIHLGSDNNGYITYCPCMGRFGNQVDHFLGALAFSKAINRTLILPPWVEYHKGNRLSIQVPFEMYFQVQPIEEYHRVLLMTKFMEKYANTVWPAHKRISFCYKGRKSIYDRSTDIPDCHAKDGNPFGPFWDTFKIAFIGSEFYGPLNFDNNTAQKWQKRYPADKWPVLAFTGAPASFPVQAENQILQRYLFWNKNYISKAQNFIQNYLPRGAFIGIHLRNGVDWIRACDHAREVQQLFASPQCLGYKNERGTLYKEICLPTKDIIIRQLKRLIKNVKQSNPTNVIRYIFVASDSNHMISELNEALKRMNITTHKLHYNNMHLDLVILGFSNYFIGNCVSSYSAFVKRSRDVKGLKSFFWAFPKEKERHKIISHEEL